MKSLKLEKTLDEKNESIWVFYRNGKYHFQDVKTGNIIKTFKSFAEAEEYILNL